MLTIIYLLVGWSDGSQDTTPTTTINQLANIDFIFFCVWSLFAPTQGPVVVQNNISKGCLYLDGLIQSDSLWGELARPQE